MYNVEDIRELFRNLKDYGIERSGTYELQGAHFIADEEYIFGTPNQKYIDAEIEWYESCSLEVSKLFNIYGREVKIWKDVADKDGRINSNYGYRIYSNEAGCQYAYCVTALRNNPDTRQAIMSYMPHDIHSKAGKDFVCTYAVQYFNNDGWLDAHVFMRSNDIIFGYSNDFAWQQHVLNKLAADTNLKPHRIYWNAGSLHCYNRHWDLIK